MRKSLSQNNYNDLGEKYENYCKAVHAKKMLKLAR